MNATIDTIVNDLRIRYEMDKQQAVKLADILSVADSDNDKRISREEWVNFKTNSDRLKNLFDVLGELNFPGVFFLYLNTMLIHQLKKEIHNSSDHCRNRNS